jgi:hypothetical protein
MSLPIEPVVGLLADNLRKRRSVMPLTSRPATRWAAGLDLPMGGETVLYTGLVYQIIPGYSLDVKSYLEVLREKGAEPKAPLESNVVILDTRLVPEQHCAISRFRGEVSNYEGTAVTTPRSCELSKT